MENQHSKMHILNKHPLHRLNLDRIGHHQQGSKSKPKIATSNVLGSPKLSGIHMRQMKMKRHVRQASHHYYQRLVHKLYPQDHPDVLFIVYFLLAVEFPHQLYFVHFYINMNFWANIEYTRYRLQDNIDGVIKRVLGELGEYNQLIQQLMLGKNRNNKGVWRRKRSQYSQNIVLPEEPSFQQLKTVSKRLAIMSRLQRKQLRNSENRSVNKTFSKLDLDYCTQNNREASTHKRPATSSQTHNVRNMRNIKHAKQAVKEEKKINEYVMSEKCETAIKKSFTNASTSVKEGLLGEYDRYNQMSKHELIEKLISLEYLANNIFRKNKTLQEKIKTLDPNYKFN